MTITGTFKKIGDLQTFASGFQKREVVILTKEQYPQPILIEFLQDKIDLLNGLNEGNEATVHINIRGREWVSPQGETKYFNSITGWKIESAKAAQPKQTQSQPTQSATPVSNENPFAVDEDDDDLPF